MAFLVDVSRFVEYVRASPFYHGQIEHVERIPERPARCGELDEPLPKPLRVALHRMGVKDLYTHQARAVNAIRHGEHVVVATSTASGKTLCYNLPVLEAAYENWRARALYLFPTKALAQDQLRSLHQLTHHHFEDVKFGTYDGDTPRSARSRLRKEATVILSNPDMLHLGILPNHSLWSHFFSHLAFVVIDEAHVYRGVFGSHVANVLRRLRRICRFYGSEPRFVCSSATIANPQEHVERLIGFRPTVVDEDGSPRASKIFVLWNPPFIDRAKMARRSANSEATDLFVELVRHGLRNIIFTKARKVAELILLYARETLQEEAPQLADKVKAYRAGYRPEQRRRIERQLFNGQLRGVTATNALELGVDIGSLDATVLVGYPGTIASTWQQAGRSGRGVRESLSVLIGLDNPLDQYFMRHPKELFERSHEHALIDPGNLHILENHLPCAAYELPLTDHDRTLFGVGFRDSVAALERQGVLEHRRRRWYHRGGDYPAEGISIRSIADERFVLLDTTQGNETLEEIEGTMAFYRVHPGAIHLHQGDSYLVTDLDLDGRIAYARPVDVNYYTQPRELNDVRIIRSFQHKKLPATQAYLGKVRVREQVVSFKRLQQFSETVISEEPLDLPPTSFETVALWWDVPPRIVNKMRARGLDVLGGLHAAEHAAIGVLPLFAMCDRWDIGGLSTASHTDTGKPQVFIYDGYPGGVGITEKGFELMMELWEAALSVIRECPCEAGCPSCIQSPKCGNNNEPLDKEAAALILEGLLRS